jgi:hypothetical protein
MISTMSLTFLLRTSGGGSIVDNAGDTLSTSPTAALKMNKALVTLTVSATDKRVEALLMIHIDRLTSTMIRSNSIFLKMTRRKPHLSNG